MLAATEMHKLYGLDLQAGRLDDARAHLTEAIATRRATSAPRSSCTSCSADLSSCCSSRARHQEAAPLVRSCLLAARRMGPHLDVSELLFGAACCTAWQGDHQRAARLHGAADQDMSAAIAVGSIYVVGPRAAISASASRARLRELMGGEAYDAGYRSGAGLSRSQAVELALGRLPAEDGCRTWAGGTVATYVTSDGSFRLEFTQITRDTLAGSASAMRLLHEEEGAWCSRRW